MNPDKSGDVGQLTLFLHQLFGTSPHSIGAWLILLLSIAVISALFKYGMRIIFMSVGRQVETEMRSQLFERIQIQSKTFYDRHGIGDLLSRLTNDMTAYRDMLGPGLMYPMFFLTMLIPAVTALFFISPLMAGVSTVPVVAIFLMNLWIRHPLFKLSDAVQRSLSDMSRMAHEYFSGIKLVKSYGMERATSLRFKELCEIFGQLNMRSATLQGLFFPALVSLIKLTSVSVVALAGMVMLLDWGSPISMGDFLAFIWIQSYVFGPLLMLVWVIPMYQKGRAAYARLVNIYAEPIEVFDVPGANALIDSRTGIDFRDLTFAYPGQSHSIFSGFNLSIQPGTFLGITGPVGSGKTTLFRLLNREYDVPPEKIFLGGQDIHCYALEAFRQDLIIVDQIPFLFSKSVRDNIKLGNPSATEEEMIEAAKRADLHSDILSLPMGYDTMIGERGLTLSGGQRQRMAIARTLLADRMIFLFDDIFSSVDSSTEKKIFDQLRERFSGKTVLFITHRVSILQQLDRVIYLVGGKIQSDGAPAELAEREGPYKNLVELYGARSIHADHTTKKGNHGS